MKKLIWLTFMVVGMTACGGATTATTTTTLPTTTAAVGGFDLAGLDFEVHQEPG